MGICVTVTIYLLLYQDTVPRFRKIRPLFLNVINAVGVVMFGVALLINSAYDVPCGLMLFMVLIGLAMFAVNFFSKALVYAVESQFVLLSKKF
jgi:hypothetical protein